jgi:hypothetical protein
MERAYDHLLAQLGPYLDGHVKGLEALHRR